MTSLALTWSAARAIAWRHLYKWITRPANFLPPFLVPLLFFTSFAGGLSAVGNVKGFDYAPGDTTWIFMFSLLQTCMFGGMATGFTIAGDFESGFARRLMLSTNTRLAILLGYLLSTFLRAIFMSLVVTAVALVVGLELPSDPAYLLATYLLALCMSFVGTLWSSGVMFRGRSAQLAPAMQMPMFLAIFLAPVYVPIDLLDGWIRHVAAWNPVTYVMEAGRDLLASSTTHLGDAILSIVILLTLASIWGIGGVRSAERAGG